MATTLPRNADVAEQLELLADILELEGEPGYRVLAYRRAAARVRETATPVAQLALEGRAKELPGIGKVIQEKIVQIVETGEIEALTRHKALVPEDVVAFTKLPGLGPKTALKIWQELGITTLAELRQAAAAERLRGVPGIGPRLEQRVQNALATKRRPIEVRPLLGQGLPAVRAVVSTLREHPAADRVSEAGSVRRRKETFRDLDIIATASDPKALVDHFTKLTWVAEIAAKGPTKATVVSSDGLRFDLRVVPPESYGNLLQHFTGSKEHNLALREDAVRRGFSVSEYGVKVVETGEVFTAKGEEELYERLGYAYIPPELRENCGELEAARKRELPELVELSDLKGDLHTHTSWSADGKNTLEEMVEAAVGRGYAYYAVTDHSHYLRDGKLEGQRRQIEQLREGLPKRFRLLHGIEANIRANGEVDVPDEELAKLDWVMASVHSGFDLDLTERVVAAMENPRVHCIGHLTGRKINKRGPAEIDLDRVFQKALETGTFLEINSQPDRLDLTDVHARAAREAGVKVVVSTDSHEIRALDHAELGVAQARRGWLTAEQVVNTRSWAQVKKLMKR
ncbi:MAG: DNA polymerase/3'-5' exonuclease PolX [Gaiellaceae bacterium]